MHGYGDIYEDTQTETVEFELYDRESSMLLFETGSAKDMVEAVRMSMEMRPDKVDNLYLVVYNVYNGRRDRDEWDVIADGAEELDAWLTKNE